MGGGEGRAMGREDDLPDERGIFNLQETPLMT